MKKYIVYASLLFGCAMTFGCSAKQEMVRGTLLSAQSRAPIQGAYVVTRWNALIANFPSSHTKCVHIAISRSDSDGNFSFSPWDLKTSIIPDSLRRRWLVYVPGYEVQSDDFVVSADGKYFLKTFSGPIGDWVQSVLLKSGEVSCGLGGNDAKEVEAFLDDLSKTIESIPGASAPVDIHGVKATAKNVLHDQKCGVIAQAMVADSPKGTDANGVYDQCLNQR